MFQPASIWVTSYATCALSRPVEAGRKVGIHFNIFVPKTVYCNHSCCVFCELGCFCEFDCRRNEPLVCCDEQERGIGQRLNIIIVAEGAIDMEGKPITANDIRDVSVPSDISCNNIPQRDIC